MQDASARCHYLQLVGETLRLELYFSSPLVNVTEVIVLGERIFSVAVEVWCCGKETLKWIIFHLNKQSTIYLCLSIGTMVHFLQILFQLFQMTLLPLSTRKPTTCQTSIR